MQGKRGLVMGVANNRSIAGALPKRVPPGGDPGLHLSGRRAQEARGAAGGGGGLKAGAPLRCHGQSLHGPGLCRARPAMGQARLPGACHRLLRQGRARRPLRRHHGEELRPDHAHFLLLVRGAGPARREAHDRGRLDADAHLLRRREGHAALQCDDGRGEGGAGSERALPLPTSGATASASTPSRPGQSRRWPPPASPTSATS